MKSTIKFIFDVSLLRLIIFCSFSSVQTWTPGGFVKLITITVSNFTLPVEFVYTTEASVSVEVHPMMINIEQVHDILKDEVYNAIRLVSKEISPLGFLPDFFLDIPISRDEISIVYEPLKLKLITITVSNFTLPVEFVYTMEANVSMEVHPMMINIEQVHDILKDEVYNAVSNP
ncbi:hypothetical protein DICVIV_14030 [Dictyocaulus viviparus]|uniref:Lipid-binding serum glycoprotein C-terminal domain-containing protein n=1 Tax=Dictyocaulus viviparus TaxID=29172 RepID=A0A0D8X684_DICVI|nr:hypothetical protein DICVIV_14030 [Dictyocaulus viviparus]